MKSYTYYRCVAGGGGGGGITCQCCAKALLSGDPTPFYNGRIDTQTERLLYLTTHALRVNKYMYVQFYACHLIYKSLRVILCHTV